MANLGGAILAYLWAYSAYMYNWLNIGGGTSRYVEEWIALSEVIPYVAFITWLTTLAFSLGHKYWRQQMLQWRLLAGFSSFAIAPTVFFLADWLLHRDFPPPPTL